LLPALPAPICPRQYVIVNEFSNGLVQRSSIGLAAWRMQYHICL